MFPPHGASYTTPQNDDYIWHDVMNRALDVELTDHLGYDKGDPAGEGSGNNRNGHSAKTVKTDHLDALRAAREVLGRSQWAEPRNADGDQAAIAAIHSLRELLVNQRTQPINHLKALVLKAPEQLRDQLRDLNNTNLITTCANLRPSTHSSDLLDETTSTKIGLKTAARQIMSLNTDIAALYERLDAQTQTKAPQLSSFGFSL